MKKNLSKKVKSLVMLGVISCGLGVTGLQSKSFADTSGTEFIEFSVDEFGNTEVITNSRSVDKEKALKEVRSKYNISSNVQKKKSADTTQSPKYWANGWVTIADKKTGKGVYHSTTARLVSSSGTVHSDSGRKWGTGHVTASSTNDRTSSNNNSARVYYSF